MNIFALSAILFVAVFDLGKDYQLAHSLYFEGEKWIAVPATNCSGQYSSLVGEIFKPLVVLNRVLTKRLFVSEESSQTEVGTGTKVVRKQKICVRRKVPP